MANFYVSIAVRAAEQAAVATALQAASRHAFVSTPQAGFVHVYDAEADEQGEEPITTLAAGLSRSLQTATLAVLNHDDDILMYWLYDGGDLVDAYNSFPGYFGSDDDDPDDGVMPRGGDAAKLVRTLGATASARKVHEVLRADNEREEYVFAVDRHAALAGLLGLSVEHCCAGFRYIAEGEAEPADRDRFVEVKP